MNKSFAIGLGLILIMIFFSGCTDVSQSTSEKIMPSNPTKEKITEITEEITPEITQFTSQPTRIMTIEPTKITESNSEILINGIDTGNAGKLGPLVMSSLGEVGPIYSDIRDDFAIKDYEKMAIDALKIRRFAEEKLEEVAHDDGLPNVEVLGELSAKDMQVFTRYRSYLRGLKDLSISIQTPLSWIKDDPSKVSLIDKMDSFSDAIAQSKNQNEQLDKLLDTCSEFGADCGQESSEIEVLKKQIEFF